MIIITILLLLILVVLVLVIVVVVIAFIKLMAFYQQFDKRDKYYYFLKRTIDYVCETFCGDWINI